MSMSSPCVSGGEFAVDTDRFSGLTRSLFTRPSRRAVTRGLVSLAAGSVFAPLIGLAGVQVEGKKRHLSKQKQWKQYCRAHDYVWCPGSGAAKNCCYQRSAICTECGCCTREAPNCCFGRGDSPLCCADNETCCVSPSGDATCCGPGQTCCDGNCCDTASGFQCCGGSCCDTGLGRHCCGGVECCYRTQTCCPDGSCHLDEFHCPA